MMKELMGRIDEMYGASLLAGIAGAAMYLAYPGGVVELCIGGVIALLVAKTIKD